MVNWLIAGAVLAVLAPFLAAAVSGWARRRLRRVLGWALRARLCGRLRHRDRVQTMGMLLSHDHGHVIVLGGARRDVEPGLRHGETGRGGGPVGPARADSRPRAGRKPSAQEVWQSRIGFALDLQLAARRR